MEVEIRRIDEKISSLEKRFDGFERRFDGLERRMDMTIDLHERIATIEAKIGH